jgi:hypothetical protein
MGYLNATIEINGERQIVKMPSFRDHSYGKNIFNYLNISDQGSYLAA